MDDEPIDVDEPEASGSLLPVIACILAVLGLGVGGTGIYFAFQANQQLQAVEDELKQQLGDTSDSLQSFAAIEPRIESLQNETTELKKSLAAIKTRMRIDRDNQEKAVREISDAINTNRQQINKNIREIAAIPEQVLAPPPEPESEPEPDTSEPAAERNTGGNTLHTIQPGDTFGKLSREYGVSLSAILKANPTVNPNRLQIGQKVVIPANP